MGELVRHHDGDPLLRLGRGLVPAEEEPIRYQYSHQPTNHRPLFTPANQSQASIHTCRPITGQCLPEEQRGLAVGDQAPVFHGARAEVGDGDQILYRYMVQKYS